MTPHPYEYFDAATLDREYSPSSKVDELDALLVQYQRRSDAAIRSAHHHRDLAYGDDPRSTTQRIAFFGCGNRKSPVMMFIHGGYWQQHSHLDSCFSAEDFTSRGIAFAALGYSPAPLVSLDDMARECQTAIAWLFDHADELNIDTRRMHLSGTSAGAQLAARMMETDWATHRVPDDVLRSVTLVSGVYDLEPIRRSYVNEVLGLDAEAAARNSPARSATRAKPPTLIGWAEDDTNEFKRQSREYFDQCVASGHPSLKVECHARNHFDVVLDLGNTATPLGRATAKIMRTGESDETSKPT